MIDIRVLFILATLITLSILETLFCGNTFHGIYTCAGL